MYGSGQGHRHSPDVASSGHESGHAFPAGHCGSFGSHSTVGSQNTAPEPRIAGATAEPAITSTPATRANILISPQDLLPPTTAPPTLRAYNNAVPLPLVSYLDTPARSGTATRDGPPITFPLSVASHRSCMQSIS